jgi:protein required for attachment to host cells
MAKPNLLVLVANSARARVLRRSIGSDELHTCLTVENGPARREARTAPGADQRRDERIRNFVEVLGAHLRELLHEHAADGLVLAAPSRMLGPLQADLAGTGAVRAAAAKDLVKFDDHEVTAHLTAELRHADGGFAAA